MINIVTCLYSQVCNFLLIKLWINAIEQVISKRYTNAYSNQNKVSKCLTSICGRGEYPISAHSLTVGELLENGGNNTATLKSKENWEVIMSWIMQDDHMTLYKDNEIDKEIMYAL